MNKKVEKIRDDLYVKKGVSGTYSVVYPMKDSEGNNIPGNLKKALLSDIKSSIPMIITVSILLMMLLPGAIQIKEECETAVENCIDDACEICNSKVDPFYEQDFDTFVEENNMENKTNGF